MHEGWVIVWVLAVIFLATLIRSAFEFGEALVAVPLLALLIPVEVAAPLADLNAAITELLAKGWQSDGEAFEIPNGPCYRFADPSGNSYAIFQNDRPGAMERAYADQDSANAIRG